MAEVKVTVNATRRGVCLGICEGNKFQDKTMTVDESRELELMLAQAASKVILLQLEAYRAANGIATADAVP